MMQLFYTRVKAYVEALKSSNSKEQLKAAFNTGLLVEGDALFSNSLSVYVVEFSDSLHELSLGQVALASFDIPSAPT